MANNYSAEKTWADLAQSAAISSENVRQTITVAEKEYQEWQMFRDSRDNTTIATALSKTAAEIADMDAAFSAGHELYQHMNNVVSSQSDYGFALRKFNR